MFCTKSFHCDPEFHGCVSISADELIVFQLDDISLFISDRLRYLDQLTRFIREKYGY